MAHEAADESLSQILEKETNPVRHQEIIGIYCNVYSRNSTMHMLYRDLQRCFILPEVGVKLHCNQTVAYLFSTVSNGEQCFFLYVLNSCSAKLSATSHIAGLALPGSVMSVCPCFDSAGKSRGLVWIPGWQ